MKDNFVDVINIENDDSYSEYLILCSGINKDDDTVWKYCFRKHNFTPVNSTEYGSCSIKKDDLEKSMKGANSWINDLFKSSFRNAPRLFLLRTHSTKPWQESEKLSNFNDKVGLLED